MWNSPAAASDDGWIEIQGWDWEVEVAAQAGGPFKGELAGIEPTYDQSAASARRPAGTSDLTMKRGTSPAPSPPSPGRVKVQFHWPACSKGQRLPSVELRDARMLYVLEGVTVTDCSPGSATLAYTGLRRSSPLRPR